MDWVGCGGRYIVANERGEGNNNDGRMGALKGEVVKGRGRGEENLRGWNRMWERRDIAEGVGQWVGMKVAESGIARMKSKIETIGWEAKVH